MHCAGAQVCPSLCFQLLPSSLLFPTVLTCSFLPMNWITIIKYLLGKSCRFFIAAETQLFNQPKLRFPGSEVMSILCSAASHTVIEMSDALNWKVMQLSKDSYLASNLLCEHACSLATNLRSVTPGSCIVGLFSLSQPWIGYRHKIHLQKWCFVSSQK